MQLESGLELHDCISRQYETLNTSNWSELLHFFQCKYINHPDLNLSYSFSPLQYLVSVCYKRAI